MNTPRAQHDTPPTESQASESPKRHGEIPARVLSVSTNPQQLAMIERAVLGRCVSFHTAKTPDQAMATIAATETNLILIDRTLGEHDGIALAAMILDADPGAVPVILGKSPTIDDAVLAMRAGAADLIDTGASEHEIRRRISVAAERAETLRQREDKIARLKKLCHTLNIARDHVTGQVGDLCNDLLGAYQTMAEQIGDVSVSSELNSLLRQELDVESLLRTVLEYLLSKIGPTNAAVFLPASTGEFSLGAYINYDCPKDAAEVLLDQMANTFAPCFEDQTEVLSLHGQDDLAAVLGDESAWLGDATALVVSCVHEGECLAVLTAFRADSKPFDDEQRRLFDIIAKLFGAQLGRVIHVHHRHLPEDQWPGCDDSEDFGNDFGDGFGDSNGSGGFGSPFDYDAEDDSDFGQAA